MFNPKNYNFMKRKIKISLLTASCFVFASSISNAQSTAATNTYNAANFIGWGATSGDLPFKVNNTTKMTLQNTTGNFGIGTTTPVYPLQVGTVISGGSLSSGGTFGVSVSSLTAAAIGEQSPDRHAIFGSLGSDKDILFPTYNGTSFDERMRITGAGNVGIGTSSPTQKLNVKGAALSCEETSTDAGMNIYFKRQDATERRMIGAISTGTTGEFDLILGQSSSLWKDVRFLLNGGDKVIIKASGNVGIGTTTPASKLDVEGGVSIGASYSGSTAAPSDGAIIQGKVGVGTSSPGARLDVYTATASEVAVKGSNQASSGSNYGGLFSAYGTGVANYGLYGNATGATTNYNLYLGSLAASANNYSIYSAASAKSYIAGNLGIGTPSSSFTFDVNGSANCNTNTWTSDQQFKTNIDSLENALEIIKQLKPKTYYFDTLNSLGFNFPSYKQHGFIAQEVKTILPELVVTANKEAIYDTLGNLIQPAITFKTLNYIGFISLLTKGIQEMQKNDDSVQTKLNVQDSIINNLQMQLNETSSNYFLLQNQVNQLQNTIYNCCNINESRLKLNSTIQNKALTDKVDVKLSDVQSLILEQNVPNPFAEQTTISYTLPENFIKAQILFYNSQGKLIQSTDLSQKGSGQLNVFASDLSNGIYTYTLIVDNQVIESKKMIKQ
jgi:hypothetical protein